MSFYLTRFNYTPATWAKLIKNSEDRRTAAKAYIESVGGKLHGFWYAFGDHEGYNLWEAPDNVSNGGYGDRDHCRRSAELLPDDCAADRRGNARGPKKGFIDRISATRREAVGAL